MEKKWFPADFPLSQPIETCYIHTVSGLKARRGGLGLGRCVEAEYDVDAHHRGARRLADHGLIMGILMGFNGV